MASKTDANEAPHGEQSLLSASLFNTSSCPSPLTRQATFLFLRHTLGLDPQYIWFSLLNILVGKGLCK